MRLISDKSSTERSFVCPATLVGAAIDSPATAGATDFTFSSVAICETNSSASKALFVPTPVKSPELEAELELAVALLFSEYSGDVAPLTDRGKLAGKDDAGAPVAERDFAGAGSAPRVAALAGGLPVRTASSSSESRSSS